MTKGKHVKSNRLIIPRGEVKPMTGIVTEDPVQAETIDEYTSAIAVLRKDLHNEVKRSRYFNEETRYLVQDKFDELRNQIENQRKRMNRQDTMMLVIVLYLLAWIIGWGMGAW